MPHHSLVAAVLAALLMPQLSGCGGRTYETDPRQLLSEGRQAVDSTPAVHFTLTSENAGGVATYISGGEGDARRPDGFAGSFSVSFNGLLLSIGVVSSGGTFYVKLPLRSTFEVTDPGKYGFSDPGHLINPDAGLSNLLSKAKTATLSDRDRLQGEELYEVAVTLPGDLVKALLTSADPSQDVRGTVGINVDNHEVRRVVLVGPFFEKGKDSTFTVILDNYGENVTVTPPPH